MSEDVPVGDAVPRRRTRLPSLLAKAAIGILLAALLLVGAIGLLLDTDLGHRLILDRIAAIAPDNGLRIRVGRIEGSIWGRTELRDVRLYDPEGLFAEAPQIELDWQPLAWLAGRLLIDNVATDLAIVRRLPKLIDDAPGPSLPDYDVHVGRLRIDRLRIDEAVAGRRRFARVAGEMEFRRGRALARLDARMRDGGDRLALLVDAAPGRDQLDLDLRLDGPGDGLFARLLGTREAVKIELGGDGSWRRWAGSARLDVGGRRSGELRLAAETGTYGAAGWLAPARFLSGVPAELAGPRLLVGAEGRLSDGVVEGRASARSAAMRLAVRGGVDLRRNSYRDLRFAAELLRPALGFEGARLTGVLDGRFDGGSFAYRLAAARVRLGAIALEDVTASGAGRLAAGPLALPLHARAGRVAGLGDDIAEILADLSATGTLVLDGDRLSGRGLRLDAARLRGRLGLDADLGSGRVAADATGAVDGYRVAGIGTADLSGALSARSDGGDTSFSGTARALFRRLDSETLRWASRGLPRIETSFATAADGRLRFPELRLDAPSLQLRGSGASLGDGAFSVRLAGRHRHWGPLAARLGGSAARPRIALRLARPAPMLSNVSLDVEPAAGGFAFRADGGSALGPFQGRGSVALRGSQAAIVRVASLSLGGATGAGTLRQGAGGVAGRIDLHGSLSGPVDFTLPGGRQRVEGRLVASDARLGALPLGSGRLEGFVQAGTGEYATGLEGRLRFDGVADRLWAASGLDQVRLSGPLRVDAELSGTAARPQLRGSLRLDRGRLTSAATGTEIEALEADGRFDESRLTLQSVSGRTDGGGTVSGQGWVDTAGRADLRLEARQAFLLARPELQARLTGPVRVQSEGAGGLVSGDLRLVNGAIRIGRSPGGSSGDGPGGGGEWRLALRLSGDRLAIAGRGLDSMWRAALEIRGSVASPQISGEAELVRGRYMLLGQPVELRRGTMLFDGETPPDPRLDILAAGPGPGIRITGRASRPEIGLDNPLAPSQLE